MSLLRALGLPLVTDLVRMNEQVVHVAKGNFKPLHQASKVAGILVISI